VRAPSNTMVPSQVACDRAPIIGALPSCQSPSKNVQVFENAVGLKGANAGRSWGGCCSLTSFVSIDPLCGWTQ
jgi:hypothetical protein